MDLHNINLRLVIKNPDPAGYSPRKGLVWAMRLCAVGYCLNAGALASMATPLRESVANAECIRATEKVELKIVPVSICKRISVQVSQQFPGRPGLKRPRPKGPFLSCDQVFANKYVHSLLSRYSRRMPHKDAERPSQSSLWHTVPTPLTKMQDKRSATACQMGLPKCGQNHICRHGSSRAKT